MAAEEDILLREVDEELAKDEQAEFIKKHGPLLMGLAGAAIIGVGGLQFYRSAEDRAAAANALQYEEAVSAPIDLPTEAGRQLSTAADTFEPGYAALSRLRASALINQGGDREQATNELLRIVNSNGIPDRLKDIARIRAAHLLLDSDVAQAEQLAVDVQGEAMKPLAEELLGLIAMKKGEYDRAYSIFSDLSESALLGPLPSVALRAELIAPVADAARRGVPLEAQQSDADAFIQSFTQQLDADLAAEVDDAVDQDDTENDDNP